jgi:hypothetical protein
MPKESKPAKTVAERTNLHIKTGTPTSYLAKEYEAFNALMDLQSNMVQRFLETQAQKVVDAWLSHSSQLRFTLPDRVVLKPTGSDEEQNLQVPAEEREQMVGGLMDRLTRTDIGATFREKLSELEASPNPAVAAAAGLIRYTTAHHMVYSMLPSGRSVTYHAEEGDEIPSIPVEGELQPESAITAATDAIVELDPGSAEEGRGELLVPYVPAARRFFLPQWVAFDEKDHLLVGAVNEAEANVASMQRYLEVLHGAVALAPYMVVDEAYQQRRYGILGQLVNQGRALARYETREIIKNIKKRASAGSLNRGLSLSLPYFDDQDLVMRTRDFEVIPAGRIMFVPGLVVRAALQEEVKVAQDTRLSASTRKHLLSELDKLVKGFENL